MKRLIPHPTLEQVAAARVFAEAVLTEAWDRADQLMGDLRGPQTDHTVEMQAVLHMHHERWDEAAEAWALLAPANDSAAMRLLLCRNLASLKTHRPQIYRTIVDADVAEAYRIHAFPDGQRSIAALDEAGKHVLMSRNPSADVKTATTQLKPACDSGTAIALLSVGDGHVFKALAAQPQTLMLGMQHPLVLIEPDPRLMLATFLLHDFTGPTGPIEQDRVMWYVGRQWLDAFRIDAMTERYFPFPQMNVKAGISSPAIERSLVRVIAEIQKLDARADQEITAHYQELTPDHFARAISKQAGRSPRVLLLTTRFSTVLQFSTRDAAEGFRALGWETMVVIEPTPHHRMTRSSIRQSIAEFKPDIVFQIDHNRFEHGDLFPPSLPFVDWIQDLLPNLMTPKAGQQIGVNDFVLTPSTQRWVDDFKYPERQCMEFRKLTRVPRRPIGWSSRDELVVYVSNWSQAPEQIRRELLKSADANKAAVIDLSCAKMIDCYAKGGTLATAGDVRRVVTSVMHDLEVTADDSLVRQTVTMLADRLNNALFRQQGLAWAATACGTLGLDLEIYGNGWDRHPTLAEYARGPIAYGGSLEALTRSAGLNLVLEPFVCVGHQRLLDAIVAGGFCLIRSNPATSLVHALIGLISEGGGSIRSAEELKAKLSPGGRETLGDVLAAYAEQDAGTNPTDQVANVARVQRTGFMPVHGEILPHLNHVTFDSAASLQQMLLRFSRDRESRSAIAKTQRHEVETRYSYAAGMSRLIEFLKTRLSEKEQPLSAAA